ncbi:MULTISPECIES: Bug family tripartite tricarboxylate transporter substrate binding protein [Prauserella salsuginis group]|uniref:Bug family tripartite tricarboxylate transporter substrate binding protein n=2 Tax=Prauserella salsuginis group TaxID=2893672 RepID=A0ABW6FY83_9PSEU|nr:MULTISPECIES: tripartite tricarboxylate transporter substrate-binding protein [Prauserella salsuginis group]MBB3662587.1 putative tricarboxylic transport membrane protein [Prauserella sediminis]MCR3720292.1 putative tricarboxylic transport membrane protein [Prauserella flava]MCR3734000.1 putative tricarboxylic transport membrane protein [Prauserella salsuginis]
MTASASPESAKPERRAMRPLTRVVAAVATVALVGVAVVDVMSSAEAGSGPRDRLNITVPAAPGGGWDSVGREIQSVVDSNGYVNTTEVLNVPGAGGAIGLARVVNQSGRGDTLMMTGTVMMGSIAATGTPHDLTDVTPIARLANDYGVVVVPANSPIKDLDDLLQRWRDDPRSVAVGGGSVGGTDHLLAGMLMDEAGADPGGLNYIPYAGGGEAVAGLLNGSLDVGVSGYDEFAAQIESGEVRALGLSAAEPVDGIDIPTFRQQNVDVELANWRGVVAPPGLSDGQRRELETLLEQVHGTEQWQDTLDTQEWQDTFLTGEPFERFVERETARITEISKELGLA